MERWEQDWVNHQARWELECLGQPGAFSALCLLDSLDVDHAGTMAWLAEMDRAEREGNR